MPVKRPGSLCRLPTIVVPTFETSAHRELAISGVRLIDFHRAGKLICRALKCTQPRSAGDIESLPMLPIRVYKEEIQ